MKITNFISNFFMNNHLLKLDVNIDFNFVLILAMIYSIVLLIYGLLYEKFSVLYTILQLIYSILNTTIILFIFGLFVYFLGNIGCYIFCILFIFGFFIYGTYNLIVNNDIYIFNIGKLPAWICDNYENKRKFYNELTKNYNEFKQYNEEII